MTDEELKPKSGDASDDASNQDKGDDSLSEELAELFSDDESGKSKEEQESDFLVNLNKLTGKNFKSLNDAAKSIKQVDEMFREKGREKETAKVQEPEQKEVKIPNWAVALYLKQNPEYSLVQKKVERVAKQLGRDALDVYEDPDFSFFKSEAKTLLEEQAEDESNKGKVKSPSAPAKGKKAVNVNLNLSDADRALLAKRGLSEKDVQITS